MGVLAVAISLILSARLNTNVDLLRDHGAAMMSGVMIKATDPFSIPSLSRDVITLQWITYGTIGVGLLILYAGLVSIVGKGWNTIKRQEADLTQTNAKLQQVNIELDDARKSTELILESAGEGVFGLDSEGIITFANPAAAKMLGCEPEELIGQHHKEISCQPGSNDAPHSPEECAICRTIRDRTAHRVDDGMFWAKNGKSFLVEYMSNSVLEEDMLVGAVVMFQNIIERKRAESELREHSQRLEASNKELQDFAFVAAHDLQEPLRKIQTFSNRLSKRYSEIIDEKGRDYLDLMEDASTRMGTLISDLLAYSRLTTKARPFEEVDLGKLSKEVVNDLEVKLERVGGRVEIGELPTIEADPTQMRQLMQNLIGNAVKFQRPEEPPVVKVNAHNLNDNINGNSPDPEMDNSAGNRFQITVEDNGIGFDPEYKDQIFTIFQRLHSHEEYEGTGMGLAICRKIVERHGGTIVAESTPGVGTTFVINLPTSQMKEGDSV